MQHGLRKKSGSAPYQASSAQTWMPRLMIAAVALVLIVQAYFFLVPLAVAVLLFSLTSAAVDVVARFRIGPLAVPHWLASFIAFVVIAAVLMTLFGIVSAQINSALATASTYSDRAEQFVAALFAWLGDDVTNAVLAAFRDMHFGAYLRSLVGSAGNLFVATVLVILYIGFLFAERSHFAAKLGRLFPDPDQVGDVDRIFDAIGRSVRHYVLVKSAVSLVTAVIVYGILVLFGIDFAESLATLTFFLNFIPNIGSIVASALPMLVALAQFGDWPSALLILLCVGIVQFAIGNILDPMLMGRALHLSSFAIILSLTFWGAVWGIVGLFLAVPIMVVAMIVCTHVPSLHPVAVLLSRDGNPFGRDASTHEGRLDRSDPS